jgi:acyl-[acyl-carrier-protein]-phospholipid O-acyltransferase/long-chain-fatty-acid--[acyl-carrier-protein] ligase
MPLPQGGVASRSFLALLATQCLGAINDNMFRWLVIGVCKDYVEPEEYAFILSAGLACFVVPYLLLAAPAGYLADRFSKRRVIVSCKVAEIVIMLLGVGAIFLCYQLNSVYPLLFVVFLMGSQSALFSPSKLGSVPELVRAKSISAANGMLGLTTVISTTIGFAGGMYLDEATGFRGMENLSFSAAALVGTAVVGYLVSLWIASLPAANPTAPFPWNAAKQTMRDLKTLFDNRALFRVGLGIALFWALGSLAQMNIDQFGFEGGLAQTQIVPMLISLVVGVGVGSVLAGIWSGGKVELGILPLGAAGIAVCSMMLSTIDGEFFTNGQWTTMHLWACVWLAGLGTSAGLFDVPLASYMQHRSPYKSRGAILAASNFITFLGMLVSAGIFAALRVPVENAQTGESAPLFDAREVFWLVGLFTLPVFVYVVWLLPQATIRFLVWLASRTVYRVSVDGRENLPETGGALLVANHMSFVDGILLLVTSSRPVRFIAHSKYAESFWLRRLARTMKVIPIDAGPQKIRQALATARAAVAAGELVCIFPEGRISRTGLVENFKPGFMQVAQGTDAPVIPVYLDGLWGSIFSYRDGRSILMRPRKWPYPVSILIGEPIEDPENADKVRNVVQALGVEAANKRDPSSMNIPLEFIRECRRRGSRSKIADTTGADLSGRSLLIRTLVLRRLLLRHVVERDEKYVGLLMPPSVGGVVANTALTLCQRVAVNLNYTVSSDVMNNCIKQCGIKHVLTSRQVMKKLDLEIDAELVYLEDFRKKVTKADKITSATAGLVMPAGMLARRLGISQFDPEETFTLIFTSGSTGEPKGVMLTGRNVASNVRAIDELVHLSDDDVLVGILPFFHSMGFTVTLWTVLTLKPKGAYHFSPLDAREVGKLCGDHRATLLLSTPTFLRGFLRRCTEEQFQHIDTVITGAEKLPPDVADAFEQKFGVRPYEGYGCTELSPLASVNIPPSRASGPPEEGLKAGTVGRTIPNVMAKIVDLDSGEDLGIDQPGMLLIKGPNVMKGYLDKPDITAKVIRDGWYVTGDVAKIDSDGFIQITGRQSRFSKIGGEMVPHVGVEEAINAILAGESASPEDDAELKAAVTSVSDARKGERLIVLHVEIDKSPGEICKALQDAGLPPIWIPSPDSFLKIDGLPMLGTGKLDLKALKQLALDHFAGE